MKFCRWLQPTFARLAIPSVFGAVLRATLRPQIKNTLSLAVAELSGPGCT